MRYILALFTLTIVTASANAQKNEIDVLAMTTRHQFIVFPPAAGATLRLGELADLSQSQLIINDTKQLDCKIGERKDITQSTVSVATRETSVSAYQELAASVEASLSFLGGVKFRLSNQEAQNYRENTLYARLR